MGGKAIYQQHQSIFVITNATILPVCQFEKVNPFEMLPRQVSFPSLAPSENQTDTAFHF